jgi:hypothetical protein
MNDLFILYLDYITLNDRMVNDVRKDLERSCHDIIRSSTEFLA